MSSCPLTSNVLHLLDERHAADESLERHVSECLVCQKAIEQAAGSLRLPPPRTVVEEPSPELLQRLRRLAGERSSDEPFPHFPGLEIIEELGRGGSSVVYKARQIALNRIVALKVLSSEYLSLPDSVARSRRGVEALAQMTHPGFVRILHAGLFEGKYYSVQEYVEGGSLAQRIDGTPWSPREAALVVAQLADAVSALHRHGYLHRDLKPANVLLSTRPPEGGWLLGEASVSAGDLAARVVDGPYPKIGDFGLIRPLNDADALTGKDVVVGTPGSMAPEQVTGDTAIGPTTDVWALGVILYHLLTGKPPFAAESATDLLGRTSDVPPPPPRHLVSVDAELEYVCLTCLHKDARHRYPSAARLRDDLLAYLSDQELPSRPARWHPRRWIRRNRSWLGIAALSMLLILVTIAWQRSESSRWQTEETLHSLRLDLARDRLEQGDPAGAWMVLERCNPRFRDAQWNELWKRCQLSDK